MRRVAVVVCVLLAGLLLAWLLLAAFADLGVGVPSGGIAGAAPAAVPETYQDQVVVTVGGEPGSASGSGTLPGVPRGYIKGVYIDYSAGLSATTDVTLSTVNSPSKTVMAKADSATDAWYYPAVQFTGSDGAAISGAYGKTPIDDALQVQVAQSSTGTVTVWVMWGE